MKLDKYDFKFGLGFLREINKGAEYNLHGIVVNAGLEKTLPNLMGRDIETLVEVLKIANKTEKPRISDAEIERIIEECDDVEALFEELIEELKTSNFTKVKTMNFFNPKAQTEE